MQENKKIIIGIAVVIGVLVLLGMIISISNSDEPLQNSGSSYSGGSSSGSSYNPADYDSKGNYKPVESMTKEEKKQELMDILKDSLY